MHSIKQLTVLALLGVVTVSAKHKTSRLAQLKSQVKARQETCVVPPESQAPIEWENTVEQTPVWEELVSEHSYVESPASYDVYEGKEYEQSTHSAPSYREPSTRRSSPPTQPSQDFTQFT